MSEGVQQAATWIAANQIVSWVPAIFVGCFILVCYMKQPEKIHIIYNDLPYQVVNKQKRQRLFMWLGLLFIVSMFVPLFPVMLIMLGMWQP